MAANAEDGRGMIKRVLQRVDARLRREGPNPPLKIQRLTGQIHNLHFRSRRTGQGRSNL